MLKYRALSTSGMILSGMLIAAVSMGEAAGETFTVSTATGNGADIELTENGGAAGAALAGGNGTKLNMNGRWNFANVAPAVPDKNEWAGMRFDLSSFADKSTLTGVSLNVYMHRANANNNKNLHLYALTPGISGENWAEVGTTYATMPGFTFDMDSTTNILDVGGALIDLGTFATTGSEAEGALAVISPATLTTLVQGMGSSNLLTILMTTAGSTNGQWRVLTKEASQSETGVITGAVGQFAPFLKFDSGAVAGLLGDYNENDTVDAADYTAWRDRLGDATSLPNDDTAGVGADDLDRWKTNFGQTNPGGSSLSLGATVPEPTALLLALAIALAATTFGGTHLRGRSIA
jgi:hypothetical protein